MLRFKMKIITETQRLVIVRMDNRDTDLLFRLTSNQQVMRYFPKVLSYAETSQMMDKILAQYKKYGYSLWKLLLRNENKFIGIAGLLHQEIDGNAETEISYRIKPQYWNRGFATEAAQACKEYAEKVLNKNRLISIIHPENIASKYVAEKLGAKKSKVTIFLGMEHEIHVY
jgi:ribosomal-protein-alanine N-acetyltransferase